MKCPLGRTTQEEAVGKDSSTLEGQDEAIKPGGTDMRRKRPQTTDASEHALTPSTTTRLPVLPSVEGNNEPYVNRVQARVGRWRASLEWRPLRRPNHSGGEPPPPQRRWPTLALGLLAVFGLGAAVALGTAWELVPYVETTRVVGELARLKIGGPVCLGLGLLLYLIR